MKHLQRLIALLCLLVLLPVAVLADGIITVNAAEYPVTRSGWYSTMEEVAVYIGMKAADVDALMNIDPAKAKDEWMWMKE